MLDAIASNTMHRYKDCDQWQIEDTDQNSWSFLTIGLMQKEASPSHRLEDHTYE